MHTMTFGILVTWLLLAQPIIAEPELAGAVSQRVVVEGTIYDAETREPVGMATVRAEGTGRSTLANDQGRYRLLMSGKHHRLKFSHVAYYSEWVELTPTDSLVKLDIHLRPAIVDIGRIKVYERAYDPAQRIIVEAIRRKEDILTKIHDYRFDAYAKLVVTDETTQDTSRIWLITESQTTSYWQQPDRYKEVISSRRQSANLEAEGNLVTVGEILNFNRHRIEIGSYSVVSPTAKDALDHYNYYLVDTVYRDSLAVFRLEVEPKNPDNPLFAGFVHIADSTYDVVEVDVGFSRGVEFPMISNLRYTQRFARFDGEYWMPIEIRFSGKVAFEFPLPGIPGKLAFAHVASIYSYNFDIGHPSGTFNEYLIEVAKEADKFDSAAWYAHQTIPLTDDETEAYRRIDSLENLPESIGKKLLKGLGAVALVLTFGPDDFFHFNRVEGAYLGAGVTLRNLLENSRLRLQSGYAFDAERWQHQYGITYTFSNRHRLELGIDYLNRVVHRPSIISDQDYNPTILALAYKSDPFDYYLQEGYRLDASGKLVNQTRLRLTYNDYLQHSLTVATDYSVFQEHKLVRENPPIANGKLRSLTGEFSYDSRKMIRVKGEDLRTNPTQYARLAVGVEYASPDLLAGDFDFRRYYLWVFRRQRTLGLGLTSLYIYAGSSERQLPPQRYFSVDFGNGFFFNPNGFNTLDEINFGGNRAVALYLYHDFRRRLFQLSGLPLVKDIPLWLSAHGGLFTSEFRHHISQPGDGLINTAPSLYSELGFGVANLTPFITPFNFAVYCTWQLSDYETSDFSIFLGLKL